jgi:hypothetical protein
MPADALDACAATEMREWNAAFKGGADRRGDASICDLRRWEGRDVEELGRIEEIAARDARN